MKILVFILLSLSAFGQRYSQRIGLLYQPAFSQIVYGFNGNMNTSERELNDAELLDSIKTLDLQVFRYPGGTISASFNWRTGLPDLGGGTACTLEDLKILIDSTGCSILFVLNMVTKDLSDQLEMLAYADSIGIPVRYVELGSEYNNQDNPGRVAYPTATAYATECATWIPAIKAVYPSVLIGGVGENKSYAPDVISWNSTVLSIANFDALTTHIYPDPERFVIGGVPDLNELQTMIYGSYYRAGMNLVTVPVWVTEYNYLLQPGQLPTDIMSYPDQVATTLQMTKTLTTILSETNISGKKIMCIHNIEGRIGAFYVADGSITRGANSTAISEWFQYISVQQ